MLVSSLASSPVSASKDIDLADAEHHCYRALRGFVREVHPDYVFVPSSKDNWKAVKSSDKNVLKIKAENYIKIKTYPIPGYKSHKAFCSYYKPTMSVISIGISPPK